MKISRILHAGYVFESGQTRILFDPLFESPFSKNCYPYPPVKFDLREVKKLKADAVFISHYHDDHCSFESLQHLDFNTPVFLYCIHEELFDLIKELGFKSVNPLKTNVAVTLGPFKVTPRLALDPEVDSIFHIEAGGLNVLNVVDAWIDPRAFEKLSGIRWDMVLWPFQTMRETEVIAPELARAPELPPEWLEQLKILNPRYVVPSSCQFIQEDWSWYREAYFPISYERFEREVKAVLPSSGVVRLNPGVTVELSTQSLVVKEPLPWILPQGQQNLDYHYDPGVTPASTADIARHFKMLTEVQRQKVFNFCKHEIIKRYLEINPELSGDWKLALYDHAGQEFVLNYIIRGHSIVLTDENLHTHWVTEVPLSKVYSAIEEGETLSSLYLRMRGMPFDNIFEDPLISALFHVDVVSYQRNQLKKIRGGVSST